MMTQVRWIILDNTVAVLMIAVACAELSSLHLSEAGTEERLHGSTEEHRQSLKLHFLHQQA